MMYQAAILALAATGEPIRWKYHKFEFLGSDSLTTGGCWCFALGPQDIAMYLGLDLGEVYIKRFADGEVYVQVMSPSRVSRSYRKLGNIFVA